MGGQANMILTPECGALVTSCEAGAWPAGCWQVPTARHRPLGEKHRLGGVVLDTVHVPTCADKSVLVKRMQGVRGMCMARRTCHMQVCTVVRCRSRLQRRGAWLPSWQKLVAKACCGAGGARWVGGGGWSFAAEGLFAVVCDASVVWRCGEAVHHFAAHSLIKRMLLSVC